MKIIGLTGLIGTGKSTVAQVLRRLRVPVHDADQCVHALYKCPDVRRLLLGYFPQAWSWRRRDFDRAKLMNYIKKRPEQRAVLNALIHPLVRADQLAFIKKYKRARAVRAIALDVPLLFETGLERLCDHIWVTSCRAELQKNRVLQRPGYDAQKFAAISAWQGDGAWQKRVADLVINTGTRQSHLVRLIKRAKVKLCAR